MSESSTGRVAQQAVVAGSPYAIIALRSGRLGPGQLHDHLCHGNLRLTPAPLTITANNATKTYGQTATWRHRVHDQRPGQRDSVSSVSGSSTGAVATAAVVGRPYADHRVRRRRLGLSNYTISYVNGSLTVNPAPLRSRLDSATKTYGQTATLRVPTSRPAAWST